MTSVRLQKLAGVAEIRNFVKVYMGNISFKLCMHSHSLHVMSNVNYENYTKDVNSMQPDREKTNEKKIESNIEESLTGIWH